MQFRSAAALSGALTLLLAAGVQPLAAGAQTKAHAVAAAPAAKASKAHAAPVKVTSVEGITEYRLANGLRVLLFPDASKPTVTTNVTYLVGSRNESYGETGMAHLLEHLMFKPSRKFSGEKGAPNPVEVLNSVGAEFNGTTWYDRTNYFVTFPASEENLKKVLDLEADRMVNALIRKSDLWNEETKKGEMSVVRNEFESGENNPLRVTIQRLESVAFDWHAYGKSTIGARADIENVNIEHLQAFYRKFYQPDNAVLMVAGKIDEAKVLAEIDARFGRIEKPSRVIEKTWTVEPTQDGERSVTVRRVGGTPVLAVAYHIPGTADPANDAVGLASQILSDVPSGRLYKALVETKLVSQIFPNSYNTLDPTLQEFIAVLPKDGDVEAAKAALIKVVEDLKSQPFTQAELDRVKAENTKNFELITAQTDRLAVALSESMAAGDWRLFFIGRDRVEKTTLAEVQAAGERFLKPSNRSLAAYLPTEKPERAEIPAAPDTVAMVKDYKGRAAQAQGEVFDPTPANVEARLQRFEAANGLKGSLLPKQTKGHTLNLAFTLHFGSEASLMDQGAVPSLTGAMLMRGTEKHNREQLKEAFDKLKAQVSVSGSPETARVRVTTTRENLTEVMRLVAEVLRQPSFPAQELETLRQQQVAGLEGARSEPQMQAQVALQQAVNPYPAGHPRHFRDIDRQIADLKAATPEQLKAFHQAFYGADHGDFSAVGDFDAKELRNLVAELFGGWKSTQPFAYIHGRMKAPEGLFRKLETPDKANAMFLANYALPLKDSDADYPALLMADYILGGGLLKSRLADRIRQKEGISYGIGSFFQADSLDPVASWGAYAIYAPQNLQRLQDAFHEEIKLALDKGFTAEELAFAKKSWRQSREVARTEDAQLAGELASDLFLGRTLAFDEALEKKVEGLSLDEVNAVLRRRLDPSRISMVVAGDFAKAAASAGSASTAPAQGASAH